ncbi:NADH dehydrogenase [ubiquinone] iron-sulfur protein 5 [Galendromus occidentalis]|uniref:NADH dehydrogenase [ubiquinone] iron-sulfur protein 5 n=1 Tax=Galendromus occidentalis TaxID=34638 RepID=A0AAJ6QNE7_9ACAR|nr:NADH dehydrogenase [ubiquinone] iron-sulfur protein 5 [Galendromus occidentalis]
MSHPGPLIYTPGTDLSSFFERSGRRPQCRPLALQLARCQDAYGYPHHIKKCQLEWEDVQECSFTYLQYARAKTIKEYREKLFKEGKLEQKYVAPQKDAINQEHGWTL